MSVAGAGLAGQSHPHLSAWDGSAGASSTHKWHTKGLEGAKGQD